MQSQSFFGSATIPYKELVEIVKSIISHDVFWGKQGKAILGLTKTPDSVNQYLKILEKYQKPSSIMNPWLENDKRRAHAGWKECWENIQEVAKAKLEAYTYHERSKLRAPSQSTIDLNSAIANNNLKGLETLLGDIKLLPRVVLNAKLS